MLHLRVHAGPHVRRHCPVSVELEVKAADAFTLYQEPGRRPRHVQLEPLGNGSRVSWMIERQEAGQSQDYRLVRSPKRRRPSPRLRWADIAEGRVQSTLDGEPVAEWQFSSCDFPGLISLHAPGGQERLLDALWVQADLAPETPRQSALVEPQETIQGPVFGRMIYRCHWLGSAHQRLAEERTQWTVFATPSRLRLMDIETQMSATTGPISFERSSSSGILRAKLGAWWDQLTTQQLVSSAGAIGPNEVAQAPAAWCALRGPVTLSIAGHPDNSGSATGWRFAADRVLHTDPFAAFGRLSSVLDEPRPKLAAGESLTLRYRLCVVAASPRQGIVRQHYLNYAFPPGVEVL